MADPFFVFQHGFAFDRTSFSAWSFLQRTQYLDRGYFGDAIPFSPVDVPCITVAHSFGLHLLTPSLLKATKTLVIIGGFCSLTLNNRQSAYLKLLQKKLNENSQRALAQFYKDCGLSKAPPKETPNLALLKEDLHRIQHTHLDIDSLMSIPNIVIIHGEKDRISPLEKGEELHALLPNSQLCTHSEGTHALPFTHPKWCFSEIGALL